MLVHHTDVATAASIASMPPSTAIARTLTHRTGLSAAPPLPSHSLAQVPAARFSARAAPARAPL